MQGLGTPQDKPRHHWPRQVALEVCVIGAPLVIGTIM